MKPPPPDDSGTRIRELEAEVARLRGELFAMQIKAAPPDRVGSLLRDGLRSPTSEVRMAAIRAIAALPDPTPYVGDVICCLVGGNTACRVTVIEFIARFPGSRNALAAAAGDPAPEVRRAVAGVLRDFVLLRLLLEDGDDSVVEKAIDSLGAVADRGSVDTIVAKLRAAKGDGLRFSALNALGKIGDPRAGDVIRDHLAKENPDNIREVAIDAAGKLKDAAAAPALAAILSESKPRLRELAGKSLVLIGPAALPALADAVEKSPDRAALVETGNAIACTTFSAADDPVAIAAAWRK